MPEQYEYRDEHDYLAHKHASAFWFWLIAAGLVWWLVSWKWALIPAFLAVWGAASSIFASLRSK